METSFPLWQKYLASEIDLGHALLLILLAFFVLAWKYMDKQHKSGGHGNAGGEAVGEAPICKKDLQLLRAEIREDIAAATKELGTEMKADLTKHNDENNVAFAAAATAQAAAAKSNAAQFKRVHERIDAALLKNQPPPRDGGD